MIGEPDAEKPHVRFDEGVQETCDIAARLRPTLPEPPIASQGPRPQAAPDAAPMRSLGHRMYFQVRFVQLP